MAESMNEILNPSATAKNPDFPLAPSDWSKDDAEKIATAEGLDITADHWDAVRALQEYYARNTNPNARKLHDALEEKFHAKGGLKYLYGILPGGPIAQGCRLAGLEAPAGSADQSFGSVQ